MSDLGPVLFPDAFAAVGLKAHHERAELRFRWIGDEQVGVVIVGLELLQFAFETFADLSERVLQEFCDPWGHHFAPVFRNEHDMRMQFVDHMSAGTPIMSVFSHNHNYRPCDIVGYMRRSTRTQDDETWRVAVIPVRLSGADHRRAHEACHKAALLWNFLLTETRAYWDEHGGDPSDKELRHRLYEKQPDLRDGLHAHTIQGVLDGMNDAVATYRENRRQGNMDAHAPHRAKNYRPLDFTAGYGWRPANDGKHIALSFGRNHKRILVRMPNISDPKTNAPVPVERWGAMRLCWDRNKRQWSLHVSVPTSRPPQGDPSNVAAIDEGIINPMAVAVETDDAYEILVINGRHARAVKHYRNTRIASLQEKLSRCVKGSKRWRKLDAKRRRIESKTSDALRNADHQTTRKVSDFLQEHDAGRIVAGDVRGIEQNTRKNETRRVRNRKNQRRRLSQWSRGRQESLLAHKTGMTIEHIDESWSSKTCPACQTRNHPNGRGYHCRNCGFTCNRDAVGAINILIRAKNGSYQPMDTNKTVHVKYLRATPIFQPEERREHGVIPGTGA